MKKNLINSLSKEMLRKVASANGMKKPMVKPKDKLKVFVQTLSYSQIVKSLR